MQGSQGTTAHAALATRLAPAVPGVLAVRGTDPATGRPTTWHLTPRLTADGAPDGYRLELADPGAPAAGQVPQQRR